MSQYYVYSLCYPNGEPFYIGKGQGNRIENHEREVEKGKISNPYKAEIIRRIQANGQEVLKQKLAEFSDEYEAYMYEWALIHMTAHNEQLTNCLVTQGKYRENSPVRPKRQVLIENPDGIYTIEEVAKMLGRSGQTVWRLIKKGKIAAQKTPSLYHNGHYSTNGHYCIAQEAIDAFFQPFNPNDLTHKKERSQLMITLKSYDVKEAADLMGVTPTTVLRRIKSGEIKAYRTGVTGGRYRIMEESLQSFMDNSISLETVNAQEQGA